MIELEQKVWDDLVSKLANRLGEGFTLNHALHKFIDDYWTILDGLANEACEKEEVKESPEEYATKTYLREKNQIIWEYVYNLNREINNLKKDVTLLKEANDARTTLYGPVKYPNNIPPTHDYPLDWYKVTANGNVPLSGVMNDTIATSGYMQHVHE